VLPRRVRRSLRLLPVEYAVRNFGRSPRRSLGSLLGSTLVIGLLLCCGAFVRGMNRSLLSMGFDRNILVLGAGSEESVERSEIRADAGEQLVAGVRGVARSLGEYYVSPEVHVATKVKTAPDGGDLLVVLRGVRPAALLVHPQVRLVEGRLPQSGADELMIGRLVARLMGVTPEQAIGRHLWFDQRSWTVCGVFDAPGTTMEGEAWAPLTNLMIATRRTTISCVILTLGDAEFADVDAFCKQRLDLELVALREADYYARLLAFFGPIRTLVWGTAALIVAGGLLGGLNTLYAAFAARMRELATLQTLGFSRPAIVLSMIQETVLITAGGALAASLVVKLFLDGTAIRYSMGSFGLTMDAPVFALALAAGLGLGIVGACLPAWRCLRPPVVEALRTT
jgi:putative ABC transport system permease protein